MLGPLDLLTETTHGMAYDAVRAVLRPLVQSLVLIRVEGARNVPASGPAMLVSNHRSVLDPLVLGAILRRHVHFIAASWMGAVPGLNGILRSMGIMILPPAGRAECLSRLSRDQLGAGALLCIFPEGAWPALGPPPRGKVAPFHHGAARIILDCGIPNLPIVPTAIAPGRERVGLRLPGDMLRQLEPSDPLGKRRFMEFTVYDTVTVHFGDPIAFVVPGGLDPKWRSQAEDTISSRLHEVVAKLLRS